MKLSNFARTERFVPETLGNKDLPEAEKFYIEADTLSVEDYFQLNAVMLKARGLHDEAAELPEKSAERALKQQQAALAVVTGFSPLASKYCRVKNLNDEQGQEITIADFIRYPIFGETVLALMQHLLGISTPSEDETKN